MSYALRYYKFRFLVAYGCIAIMHIRHCPETWGQTDLKITFTDTTGINQQLNKAKRLLLAGHADSASLIYISTLNESRFSFYHFGSIRSLIGIGNTYVNIGDYQRAISIYREAIPLCNTERTRKLLTTLYNNMGNIYVFWGNFDQSMIHYEKALSSAGKYGTELPLETIYNNISIPLNRLNQPRKALFYLNKGEEMALQNDNYYTLADLAVNKGVIYTSLNDYTKSKACYQTALKIAEQYDYINVRHAAYTNMGILALNKNFVEEAIDYFHKAEAEKGSTNPYYRNLRILASGAAYLKLKQYSLAESYLKQSLAIAEKSNILNDLITVHKLLAEIYAETGKYKLAFQHRSLEKEFSDSISKQETIKAVSHIEAQYRTALKDQELTSKQLTINRQQNDINSRNLWILGASAGLLLLITFLLLQRKNYKHRQKLEQEQVRNLLQQQELSIMKAIMSGEEKERIRLSRELHDSIMIQFSVVKMNLSSLIGKADTVLFGASLQPLVEQLDQATDNLRNTAHNLMPDMLLEEGLPEALFFFCKNLQKYAPLKINFQPLGLIPRFQVQFELSVYRIVQELIQNIVKHAEATEAIVQISFENKLLSVTVEDNGKGMAGNKMGSNSNGLGLKSIYARITSLKGRIDIESGSNIGTTIRMEFDEPEQLV